MADQKVYTPEEIAETPFPSEGDATFATTQSTSNNTYSANETKPQPFPDPRIAVDLIGSALNTKSKKIIAEFQFTPSGAIQIGQYASGISGDIRISPSGIVARNDLGEETFTLDGQTGDAVFAGTIQTGTLIAGLVVVGNNSVVIDGDQNHPRILLYNNNTPEILIGRRA